MDRLYICHTPYHVLMACEYALADAKEEGSADSRRQSILLMDSVGNFEIYAERLRNSGLFDRVFTVRHSEAFASWTNTFVLQDASPALSEQGPATPTRFLI